MSQLNSLEDIPKSACTDRESVPTRVDAQAETIDICNGLGTDEPDGRAGTDGVTIVPPRLTETITQTGPLDPLPAHQPLDGELRRYSTSGMQRQADAPAAPGELGERPLIANGSGEVDLEPIGIGSR